MQVMMRVRVVEKARNWASRGEVAGASSSVVSPKKQTQAGPSSTLAPPRVCSSDAVLGWFQLLADPKPEKVRVNVDYELAGRRAVTPTPASHNTLASCGDELQNSVLRQLPRVQRKKVPGLAGN